MVAVAKGLPGKNDVRQVLVPLVLLEGGSAPELLRRKVSLSERHLDLLLALCFLRFAKIRGKRVVEIALRLLHLRPLPFSLYLIVRFRELLHQVVVLDQHSSLLSKVELLLQDRLWIVAWRILNFSKNQRVFRSNALEFFLSILLLVYMKLQVFKLSLRISNKTCFDLGRRMVDVLQVAKKRFVVPADLLVLLLKLSISYSI